jgi:hypothetical protein
VTGQPIVPREWADLFIAVVEFAQACGAETVHMSDPVKAAAMSKVILAAVDLMDDQERIGAYDESGRDLAAQLVAKAEGPT